MLINSRKPLFTISLAIILPFLFTTIAQSTCTESFTVLAHEMNITSCNKLSTLGAEFAWKYHHAPNHTTQLEVLFGVPRGRHVDPTWVAWGLNPGPRPQMVGTQALIGIAQENGTMPVRTYNVTAYTKRGCRLLPSDVDLRVRDASGARVPAGNESNGYLTLFVAIDLDDRVYDVARLNHVWQVGFAADPDTLEPYMHPVALQNFDSFETINMTSGESRSVGHHRRHLRVVHGILNIVGWGTLLPIGVIVARYFREFPFNYKKRWFPLHTAFQIVGYIIGTTGWGIGIGLGHASKHYTFHTHRLLAIFIFTFTTLQMLALRLRPKSHDEYRKYWDMYHHFLGYALLAAIAFNMFRGIAIFKPNHTWKWTYIGILGALGAVALAFEVYTWVKFLKINHDKRKSGREKNDSKKSDNNIVN